MKKTLLMLAIVAGITSFAQNATAALIYNASPGFSESGGFFGTYNILGNPNPNEGGFYLDQIVPNPSLGDPSVSLLSSYSDSHFSFASLNEVVNASLVPSSNFQLNLVNGTYYVAFDVVDQSNSNAVYYGWMNVTVVGADTFSTVPPVTFTLNSYAYDNTGGSILVGQTSAGPAAVPEPGTWAAAALLAGGAAFMRWRKRKQVS